MGDESFEEEEDMLREEEDDEDAELNEVFRSGIYYSHMVSRRRESSVKLTWAHQITTCVVI